MGFTGLPAYALVLTVASSPPSPGPCLTATGDAAQGEPVSLASVRPFPSSCLYEVALELFFDSSVVPRVPVTSHTVGFGERFCVQLVCCLCGLCEVQSTPHHQPLLTSPQSRAVCLPFQGPLV